MNFLKILLFKNCIIIVNEKINYLIVYYKLLKVKHCVHCITKSPHPVIPALSYATAYNA
jgi:hypothetical protein